MHVGQKNYMHNEISTCTKQSLNQKYQKNTILQWNIFTIGCKHVMKEHVSILPPPNENHKSKFFTPFSCVTCSTRPAHFYFPTLEGTVGLGYYSLLLWWGLCINISSCKYVFVCFKCEIVPLAYWQLISLTQYRHNHAMSMHAPVGAYSHFSFSLGKLLCPVLIA